MIRFRDTATLALTKLRTRKVRLVITIIVSGLLFSGLAGASSVARGAFGSISAFTQEGLGNRYIVNAIAGQPNYYNNATIIKLAEEIHKETVERKKAEAKRLGIAYDSVTEMQPVQEFEMPGSGKQRMLNQESPAAKQAIREYMTSQAQPGLSELKKQAAAYEPKAFYESRRMPFMLEGQRLAVLKDGKEAYGTQKVRHDGPPVGTDSFASSWTLMNEGLLRPFVLSGQTLDRGDDGSMPVIVPLTAAQELSGLKPLPDTAKPSEQLERTKALREKLQSVHFDVCYRNSTSAELVDLAIQQTQDYEKNKNKKEYQRPELMYGLPTTACGAAEVVRDARSADQKALDAKQEQFDQLFGKPVAAQKTLRFRIVGVVPDPPEWKARGVGDIIGSLVTSSLGPGWYTPLEQAKQDATITGIFDSPVSGTSRDYQIEFAAAGPTQDFMNKENCSPDFSKGPDSDPFAECLAVGKPFMLSPYGSNSLGLHDAKKWFGKIFTIAALIVAAIAMIIMMGTVGRMIADSRRETAVFRAIGAKKIDVAQIYSLYTILLALLISTFALLGGLIFAGFVHHRWSDGLTVQALIAYNAQDLTRTFDLYSLYAPDMLLLVGLALAGGLLSAVFPLIRNLRRNPIRDMRDDT